MKSPVFKKRYAKEIAAKAKAEKARAAKGITNEIFGAVPSWIRPLLDDLKAFSPKFEEIKWRTNYAFEEDRRDFIFKLTALSSAFPDTGVRPDMEEDELQKVTDQSDKDLLRELWELSSGTTDEASLLATMKFEYSSHVMFDIFRATKAGSLLFDVSGMNEDARRQFRERMAVVEELRQICGNGGFLAWDVGERIVMCRRAYAIGLLSRKRFWQICDSMAARVAAYYDNWGDYAISYVCGDIFYILGRLSKDRVSQRSVSTYIRGKFARMRELSVPGGVWRSFGWPRYDREAKKLAIAMKDIIPMVPDWEEPKSCLASDRITVDGAKVGYMRYERPTSGGDSGWVLAAGDESDEYMRDPKNMGTYDINAICNYDPDITEFIDFQIGCVIRRSNGGDLRLVSPKWVMVVLTVARGIGKALGWLMV
ncbi:MAG: DUF2185 domain-containing protein [Deltaproteobacteria bacterium]|jgi:hypothetical protein|nr:DUF2185 domain-containing protein [Deltaproteobacteria bacterium]